MWLHKLEVHVICEDLKIMEHGQNGVIALGSMHCSSSESKDVKSSFAPLSQ